MQRTIEIHRVQFAIISPAQELVESTTAGVHKTSCMLMPLAPCLKCQAVDLLAARNSSSFWGAKSVHPVRRAICACMWLAALGRPPRLGANGATKAPLTNTWTFRSVSGFRENNTCIKCWPFVFTSSPRSLQTSCGSGRTRHEHDSMRLATDCLCWIRGLRVQAGCFHGPTTLARVSLGHGPYVRAESSRSSCTRRTLQDVHPAGATIAAVAPRKGCPWQEGLKAWPRLERGSCSCAACARYVRPANAEQLAAQE